MAVKYLSPEWKQEMEKKLNEEFSSKGLVSTVFIQVMTDCPDGKQRWALTEIEKGKFVRYEIGEGEPPKGEFAAIGAYATHRGCVTGELDGEQCLVSGDMNVKGNMVKGMTLIGTYRRLEEVEQSIELLAD